MRVTLLMPALLVRTCRARCRLAEELSRPSAGLLVRGQLYKVGGERRQDDFDNSRYYFQPLQIHVKFMKQVGAF